MKHQLINEYLHLRAKLKSITRKDWAKAVGYPTELRMRRVDKILKARYGCDISLNVL